MLPILVIGAGSSGLVAAKNLRESGFTVEVLERQHDLGGNWNFSSPAGRVYRSTRMISSKSFTQYPDYPMPRDFPPYPHHAQVLEYLRLYAKHFGLGEVIRYGVTIERVEPIAAGGGWRAALAGGETRDYSAVVIANGHHAVPRRPEYPGTFAGQVLHSAEYKSPEMFSGKRVLVVGGGNSGCDIAVEAAQSGAVTFHSTRRGYFYIPKFFAGLPSDWAGDLLHAMYLPLWLQRMMTRLLLRITVGPHHRTGLPRPDHRLFETHPVVNTLLPFYVAQGDVRVKPDIARLCGDRVEFQDGSVEPIDVIVFATGYRLEFPFIDRTLLNWQDGRPALYLNVFHPQRDDLFVAGMIQPDSGIFGLVHWQTLAIARLLTALRNQSPTVAWFRRERQRRDFGRAANLRYQPSERHSIEVEHWSYRRRLMRLARRLS